VDVVRKFASGISAEEQEWLFGKTAVLAYGLT
jgi:hypothetical protein